MIRRHSHIFGGDRADDPDAVLDLWARNKMKERGQKRHAEVLREVSRGMPALMRADKLIDKALRAGVGERDGETLAREAPRLAQSWRSADREAALGEALFLACALARRRAWTRNLRSARRRIALWIALRRSRTRSSARALPLQGDESAAAEYWNRVKLREIAPIRQEL